MAKEEALEIDGVVQEALPNAMFPVIVILCCAFACWAWYNKLRFSGERDKRQVAKFSLKNTEIATSFQLEEATIENLQQAHLIFIEYDRNGRIAELEFT